MNGNTKPVVYTDIEIYIFKPQLSDVIEWLKSRFSSLSADPATPGSSTTHHFFAKTDSGAIRITVVEKIARSYTSVFFDSPDTPWKTDLDCARDAFRHLQLEVRCCVNSWSPEQNPDEWLSIAADGESVITWQV